MEQLLALSELQPDYRSTLLGLIRNTIVSAPVRFKEAMLAWNEDRIDDSSRILHTLRGSIGTLGAERFAGATQELEDAICAKQAGSVPLLFDVARRELDETIAAANAWLERLEKPGVAARAASDTSS